MRHTSSLLLSSSFCNTQAEKKKKKRLFLVSLGALALLYILEEESKIVVYLVQACFRKLTLTCIGHTS